MKRILSIVIVMTMVMSLLTIPAKAEYVPQFEYEAQMLYDLGLFKGTENGFELDKKCDRLQAAALFIRLLGKEEEAISNPKEHPFTDVPQWASPYVGQMYHDGYTKGISATEYGIGDITANQFATFCLRALRYIEFSESVPETVIYTPGEALDKMLECFIIRQETYDTIKTSDIFFRDHAVKMAYNSLFDAGTDNEGKFLIRRLTEKGIIDTNFLESHDIFVDEGIRYLYSPESFVPYFEKMIREATSENKIVSVVNKHEYKVKLTNTNPDSLLTQELLFRTSGGGLIQHREVTADDLTTNWYERAGGAKLYYRTTIDPTDPKWAMTYRCTRYITHGDVELTDMEKQVVEKTEEFLDTITDNMSDYDKYKAAYDYLTDNVKPQSGAISADIDVIVRGKSACGGYANSYLYLCKLMGLECWSVSGTASGEGHGWNKVKLNGKYYNVDAAYYTTGYKYFLFRDLPERVVYEVDKIYDFPCTEDYKH